ncbi:MAG: S-layer homology domain-containing protein [Chloroflexia bacterium]
MHRLILAPSAFALIVLCAWLLRPAPSSAISTMLAPHGPATATATETTIPTVTSTTTPIATATPTSTPNKGCDPAWSHIPSYTTVNLEAVAAVSHYDAWAVGSVGAFRWNGTAWNPVPLPTPPTLFDSLDLRAVAARQADDVWAAGRYSDGFSTHNIVYHWDGLAWSLLYAAEDAPSSGSEINVLEGITPIGAGEAIAVGRSLVGEPPTITHCDVSGICMSMPHPVISGGLYAVDAASADDVWAVGTTGSASLVMHYDGISWQVFTVPDAGALQGVAVIAPDDIWAVSLSGSLHWDGSTWDESALPFLIFGISGIASDDIWAVGRGPFPHLPENIWHWNGVGWGTVGVAPGDLFGVSALTLDDVWTVGADGYIARYQPPQQFEDVQPNSTFYYYTNDLSCRGIISGYPCGSDAEPCMPPNNRPYYRPQNNVTRGQLSKIVVLSAGFELIPNIATFEDVPIGSTFHPYIQALYVHGAITGYPCGGPGELCIPPSNRPYFRPNATSTRAQISKIVAIAADFTDPVSTQTFEDVPLGSTFHTWVENLAQRTIITGYPCGGPGEPCVPPGNRPYFRPQNNVTRGQMSKIAGITFFP